MNKLICAWLILASLLCQATVIPELGVGQQAVQAAESEARLPIAVVSFKGLGVSEDYRYLEDGLPEAITSQLVKIPRLDVLTRTRVEAVLKEQGFAQSAYVAEDTAPRIGHLVGAQYLLTGRYQVDKQHLLLMAQLIEVESGRIVFAETFKAAIANKLQLQVDVARHIADKLSIKLDPKLQSALKTLSIQNERALRHYLDGLRQQEASQWQGARDAFIKAIDAEPGFTEAHQHLLDVAARLEQVQALLPSYQQWVSRKDCPPLVWNYLGNVYVARQEWTQAEQAYNRVIAQAPEYVPVYNNLGVLTVLARQDYPTARNWFQKALRLDPLEPVTYFNLGKWHYDQQEHEQGQTYFRKALELSHGQFLAEIEDALFGGELKIYGQSRQLPGGQIVGEVWLKRQEQAPVLLLEILDDLGQFDRVTRAHIIATRMKSMLFELLPENIVEGKINGEEVVKTRSDQLIVTVGAQAAERLGLSRDNLARQWAKSLAYYLAYEGTSYRTKSASPVLPEEVQWLKKGDQLYQERRYHDALTAYKQALDIKWKLFAAHYSMGMIYMELGDYAQAEASFEHILRVDPNYVQAHLALGELYFRTAHYDEAKRFLLRALELDADNRKARSLLKELPGSR